MKKHTNQNVGNILLLPMEVIKSNPLHPRLHYDETQLAQLTESISRLGLLRPLTVICENGENYYIVSGERRYRAAVKAGMTRLPCILLNMDRKKAALAALCENIQQKDLHYFEIAAFLERMHDVYGCSYEEITQTLSLRYADVNEYLRLLKIDPKMREKMVNCGVTKRHALLLLKIPEEKREGLLDEIIEKRLNVNMTALRCKEIMEPKKVPSGKVVAYFKNTDIFINTVNKAVKTMQNSGIEAECVQNESEDAVDYHIHIPKIG